ncbi:MAG: DUF3990 domain-containing protein [Bacteroides sp.]|nr:DUF3990 domain-containing protein [Roseburia sp.]MCM1347751.1 DUF3990 domain-containing protein [Bacteroides sp.]MCM1422146.1 DUF3990 domain-containing protein [Bacteroides sp.]
MKLYHSSNVPVKCPDTEHSRKYLDFGKGFYLTTLENQAVKYGNRFIRREEEAWLNVYELELDAKMWNILEFDSYNTKWLEFVSKCRAGEDDTDYDIVIGGIANDKVIRTLDRFFAGELSAETTIGLLKYEKPNNQYCIRSQRMIDECLTYLESRKI